MAELLKPLALAAMIVLAGPAAAQDSTEAQGTTETPAEAPAEAPAAATGATLETYVDEVFDDWQRECVRLPEGEEAADPCRMAQTIFDAEQKPVGKIAVNRTPAGSNAAASGELALPLDLGILLPQGLNVGVDQGLSKQYDFYMCMSSGCISRLLFSADDVQAFKAGQVMNLSLVAFLPPDRQATRIQIPVSLKGFTAAFDSLAVPGGEAAAAE